MAEPLAIYGAAIGTAAAAGALWNIYHSVVRDRANLRLLVVRGDITNETGRMMAEVGFDGPVVFTRAINVGRRPITIVSGGLEFGSRKRKVLMDGAKRFPLRMDEGDEVTLWITGESLVELMETANGSFPTRLWFMDAGNKYHRRRIPRRLLRGLGKE